MFIYIFADFMAAVSLFTREWIEINSPASFRSKGFCLPLYEGVD